MVQVSVSTYGNVNKEAGWNSKEVTIEQERATVEDVLKSVKLGDGRALFDLVGDAGQIKDEYMIWLNGVILRDPKDLQREVKNEDEIVAGDFVEAIGGG